MMQKAETRGCDQNLNTSQEVFDLIAQNEGWRVLYSFKNNKLFFTEIIIIKVSTQYISIHIILIIIHFS